MLRLSVRLKLEPSCGTDLAIAAGAIHHVDIEKHFAVTAWAITDPSLSLRPAGMLVRHVPPVCELRSDTTQKLSFRNCSFQK